ncbi:MAG: hypothetical protein IJR48_01220 [Oscillibacter sp.]|nr:hypothetical protein [Oscillibacter sp.]
MKRGGTVCGAVSLTVIFCVLCMAVFAALTFVTANRERVLSELDARRAAEFYRADADATRIAAALRNGERPSTVDTDGDSSSTAFPADTDGVTTDTGNVTITDDGEQLYLTIIEDEDGGADEIRYTESDATNEIRYTETDGGTIAEFSLPAGGEQRLDVRLLLRGDAVDVLQWKKVYAGDWEANDTLTLADIGDFLPLADIN